MWMRALTAVMMFETKRTELEWVFVFLSLSERRGPNESNHACQDQTLQTKAVSFFIQWQKRSLFSLKQNKAQAVGERKPELTFHHLFAITLGKWS